MSQDNSQQSSDEANYDEQVILGLPQSTILTNEFPSDDSNIGSSFMLPSDLGESSQDTVGKLSSYEVNVSVDHPNSRLRVPTKFYSKSRSTHYAVSARERSPD